MSELASARLSLRPDTQHLAADALSCVALSVAPNVLTGGCGAQIGSSRRLSNRWVDVLRVSLQAQVPSTIRSEARAQLAPHRGVHSSVGHRLRSIFQRYTAGFSAVRFFSSTFRPLPCNMRAYMIPSVKQAPTLPVRYYDHSR